MDLLDLCHDAAARPFLCKDGQKTVPCDKTFARKSDLRPYKCQVQTCLKTFCRKTTLTKHIKKNHPGVAPPTKASYEFDYSEDGGLLSSTRIEDDVEALYALPPLPVLTDPTSHDMTPTSSHSSYPSDDEVFSPHLAHLEPGHAHDLRAHLDATAVAGYPSPPPVHPQLMHPPIVPYYHPFPHPVYSAPPPPHPGFRATHSPNATLPSSHRHFPPSAPPPHLRQLSTAPYSSSSYPPSYSYPSPTSSHTSPIDNPRSPTSVYSAGRRDSLDFTTMQIQSLNSVSSESSRRRNSGMMVDTEGDLGSPYRQRRKSSLGFPPMDMRPSGSFGGQAPRS
ncbi:hypothetical protein RQP46_009974 [Phenoliferia psychrophenolica]